MQIVIDIMQINMDIILLDMVCLRLPPNAK